MKYYVEPLILIFLGLGLGWLWHQLYVAPHDEARYQIMECMGDDHSEAAYQSCVKKLRPKE